MKILKYLSILLICFIFIDVKAIDKCTTEEMNRLRSVANNVQFKTSYEFEEKVRGEVNDLDVFYRIEIINDNEDLKYYYSINSLAKKEIKSNELSNLTFSDGNVVTIYIYSYSNSLCTDELLRTETIKLPKYNSYYYVNKEKCSKYPEFKYCREFMDIKNKSFDSIDKEFDEYIKQNSNPALNFIEQYLYYIIAGGVVLIIGVVVLIIYLKRRRDRLDI